MIVFIFIGLIFCLFIEFYCSLQLKIATKQETKNKPPKRSYPFYYYCYYFYYYHSLESWMNERRTTVSFRRQNYTPFSFLLSTLDPTFILSFTLSRGEVRNLDCFVHYTARCSCSLLFLSFFFSLLPVSCRFLPDD